MPNFRSIMHVVAITPFPEILKKLLADEYLYSLDHHGRTPLNYALRMMNTQCIDIIIEHFKEKRNQFRFVITYEDVKLLLENDYPNSFDIFAISFFDYSDLHAMYSRGEISGDFYTLYSNSAVVKRSDLIRDRLTLKPSTSEERQPELEYLVSKFSYNSVAGSYQSLEFLELVRNSNVDKIWLTDFRYIIDRKWNGVRHSV